MNDISITGYFDKSEISYCLPLVEDRIANQKVDKFLWHREELEECVLHDFDHEKLENTLCR